MAASTGKQEGRAGRGRQELSAGGAGGACEGWVGVSIGGHAGPNPS